MIATLNVSQSGLTRLTQHAALLQERLREQICRGDE